MSKHNFGYFIHEGVSNMFSHGFMSFAAIGITVACLLIMGTFTLVAVNANGLLKDLERENEMLAFVEEDFAEPKNLQSKLAAIPNVASVTFISRQQAMERFVEQYPDEEMFRDLDPNILRDRFSIKVADLERISQTKAAVDAVDGIAYVNASEEIAGGFITLRNVATVVCVALIAICSWCPCSSSPTPSASPPSTGGRKSPSCGWWGLPTALSAGPSSMRASSWASWGPPWLS